MNNKCRQHKTKKLADQCCQLGHLIEIKMYWLYSSFFLFFPKKKKVYVKYKQIQTSELILNSESFFKSLFKCI